MKGSEFLIACLRDPRLAPLATSPLPAWLWNPDASRIRWANPTGAALFGADTLRALTAREFRSDHPVAAQIARLADTLPEDAAPRLERLRGVGGGVGRALTCACTRIVLADGQPGILVVSTERAGPPLTLEERAQRLLAGVEQPMAVFVHDGALLHATSAALLLLPRAATLGTLEAGALAAEARETGFAQGSTLAGSTAMIPVGSDDATMLIATFAEAAPPPEVEPETAEQPESRAPSQGPEPAEPVAEPVEPSAAPALRHPLRFVWQMDEADRFTLRSDEFLASAGLTTRKMLGLPWDRVAAELALDADGRVAQAIASRDTWSRITVAWPADDWPQRLPVELSGVPAFDGTGAFRGYRGFGVCRDLDQLAALAAFRESHPPAPVEEAQPLPVEEQPPSPQAEPETLAELETEQAPPNVVPFRPGGDGKPQGLSPVERHAFRELARELTARLGREQVEQDNIAPVDLPTEEASDFDATAEHEDEAELVLPAVESMRDVAVLREERALLDQLPIGILLYRFEQLLHANPAFLAWAGYASLGDLAHAGGLDALYIAPGATAVGEESGGPLTITSERSAAPREGRLFSVPWEGETAQALLLLEPAAGVAQPAAGVGQDTAEAEAARAQAAELKSILDIATDGVIVIDAVGQVLSANRGAEALFGRAAGGLNGERFAGLFVPDAQRVVTDMLDGVVRSPVGHPTAGREITGVFGDGEIIPLVMTMARIAGGDKLCAVLRDMTPWKKAEADLVKAKQAAEKSSTAKSDFLAKISHEIRTPLNAIIGFSEVMLGERFGPIGNDRYRSYLKDIHDSGDHLVSLLNDLLDLSKIEAGKLDLSISDISLNDLTQQCVAMMQPQANRERIIIRSALSAGAPRIAADARSVRQILLNLLSNSIKFTGAGGQVIVSTVSSDPDRVMLHVRDTGVGMSEQDVSAALEPFRQLATAPRFGSGGTGLGLPLTKALAEANGATFNIKSAPNAGTLVEVAFRTAS